MTFPVAARPPPVMPAGDVVLHVHQAIYHALVSTKLVIFVGLGTKFLSFFDLAMTATLVVSGMDGRSSARIFWNSAAAAFRTAGSKEASNFLKAASSVGLE